MFFAMAFVAGGTLGQRVRSQGPLPPSEAARILREVGWALAYAHAQAVIHRDVKPDNILLEEGTGRALVTDFGIAGFMQGTAATGLGEIIGTAEFMSPEQASGKGVDARSDIYSLGVVGFYALSGRLPFQGTTVAETVRQLLEDAPPTLGSVASGIPSRLARVVDRCLQKDPAARFESAELLAEAVDAALRARRDVPVPVRMFVSDPIDLPGDGPLYFTAGSLMGLSILATLELFLADIGGSAAWGFIAGYLMLMVGIPVVLISKRVRRLLASGHTLADVEIALRREVEEKREELLYAHGEKAARYERLSRVLAYAGLGGAMGAGGLAMALAPLTPSLAALLGPVFGVSSVVGVLSSIMAREQAKQRVDMKAERRFKFWRSRFGHLLAKLSGIGLRRPAIALGATHRPTELQVGLAVEALFESLSREVRHSVGDVPAVVHRLEANAQSLRQTIERLQEAEAATLGAGEGMPEDLVASRQKAERHLADAVAGLETIRLGLLRLSAGAGSIEGLTTDLLAAGEIGDNIDHMLEGLAEVEESLKTPV